MLKHKILWVPGLVCTEDLFNHQINSLSDIAEHEVFVVKTYDDIKKAASYVLENTNFKDFTIVGFSMGGYISLEVLKQAPERVNALCLINSNYKEDSEARKKSRLTSIKQAKENDFNIVGDNLFASMVFNKQNKDNFNIVKEMANEIGVDSFINQQKLILSRKDSTQALKDFKGKSLFIAGRQDNLTPLQVHNEMKELSQKGNLAVIEECGHLSPVEQPQAVTSLIRYFLDN